MSPHIYITFSLKPAKIDKKEKKNLSMRDIKVNELHMKIECPKIKPHPKNVWQNLENPPAHPKCVDHL
jgi:hypothetical protein